MARLAISFCGEGRGHATRVAALIELLSSRHHITLFGYGEGLEYLLQCIPKDRTNIESHLIKGPRYHYTKGRIDTLSSYIGGALFIVFRADKIARNMIDVLNRFRPELAIVDFEPCLPRAAEMLGIPCLSIDHQHFMRFYKLNQLPISSRLRARLAAFWVCRYYVPRCSHYIISAFFRSKLLRGTPNQVTQVGAIVRRDILCKEVFDRGFLVCYLRRHTPASVFDILATCCYPVRVYGTEAKAEYENISFHSISRSKFVTDLADCTAVIAAAGNQLLGECISLGKPVLALPEREHHEQVMNSYYLRSMQMGDFCFLDEFTEPVLRNFLESLSRYRASLPDIAHNRNAANQIIQIINRWLPDE